MQLWQQLNGTIVNAGTVLAGSAAGLALGHRLPERYQRIVLDVLGLVTLTLGVDAAVLHLSDTVGRHVPDGIATASFGARLAMVMVGSLILGALIGTAMRLHERLEGLGSGIHAVLAKRGGEGGGAGARFAEGFLTASVIFCVGPLTLLGCLNNGGNNDPSLLYIKAFLDAFCSMALASALGLGVLFSVFTVLIFQGGLSLAAAAVVRHIPDLSLRMMNVVGGVVLLATALMLLEIRKIPAANLLPAIFLPPLLIALAEMISPGVLMGSR